MQAKSITSRSRIASLWILTLYTAIVLSPGARVSAKDKPYGWAVGKGGQILYTWNGSGWNVEANSPTNSDLNAVTSADGKEVWAVGNNGTIVQGVLKMKKKQRVWEWTLRTDKDIPNVTLRALTFPDKDHGWAVGDGGTILYYESGSGWTKQDSPKGTPNLYGVHFLNTKRGWAVGDVQQDPDTKKFFTTILFTDDGAKWDRAKSPPTFDKQADAFAARGVSFLRGKDTGRRYGWIVGDNTLGIWVSDNSGQTWTLGDTKKGGLEGLKRSDTLLAVKSLAGTDVWAVGTGNDNNIVKWDGAKWVNKRPAFLNGVRVTALSFLPDGRMGWMSAIGQVDKKPIYVIVNYMRTSYGKDVWNPIQIPAPVYGIFMRPPTPKKPSLGSSSSPDTGIGGVNSVTVTGSDFPDGDIDPNNVVIELTADCHGYALGAAPALNLVSGDGDSKLISFLLPSGLDPGQYYISISDYADGDANFGSSNCSVVNVVR